LLEVELKAWADLDAARARLEALGKKLEKSSVKEDLYLCAPEADPRTCDPRRDRVVRIRIEGDEALVTAKRKKIEGGVETSEEIELSVSSARALRSLLDYMGYRPFLKKRKESRAYAWGEGVHVELNRIEGLGDFVEIEALVPVESSPATVDLARQATFAIARDLGVASRIEPRPYAELLREKGVGLP
jgi:predicted adenylyl cyclase CyaB